MTAFEGGLLGQRALTIRSRVIWTALLLLLFRALAHVPVLKVNEEQLNHLLANNPLVGIVNLFAGGEVLTHFSLVAAGILPYLVALALVEWGAWVVPSLRELRLGGEQGEKRLELLSKLLSIPLAFLFAWLLSQYLAQQTGLFPGHIHWFTAASFLPSLWIVCLVTLGSLISTYISSRITKKGIGSGEDIILLAGASLGLLTRLVHVTYNSPEAKVGIERLGALAAFSLVVVLLSIYLLKGMRRVPLEYVRRPILSRRIPLPEDARPHLPLLINYGRTRPITAAIGWLVLLQLGLVFLHAHLGEGAGHIMGALSFWTAPGAGSYWLLLACLIVLFTYIYNFQLIWQPFRDSEMSLADSLIKGPNPAFIPGIRPGKATQKYLMRAVWWNTIPGAFGLAFLAAGLPYAILRLTNQNLLVAVLSLMVIVERADGVADSVRAYRIRYEGFRPTSRIRKHG